LPQVVDNLLEPEFIRDYGHGDVVDLEHWIEMLLSGLILKGQQRLFQFFLA